MGKRPAIADVRTFQVGPTDSADGWASVKPFLFVRIETEAGLVGWGEAYVLRGRERAVEQMILALGVDMIGAGVVHPRVFRDRAVRGFADKRTSLDLYCAVSAIEIALWDLLGKELGAPIHRLLGGALRERVPLYATTYSDKNPTVDAIVERARRLAGEGFRAVKIYPMELGPLDAAEDCVRRLRNALDRNVGILIDLNGLDDAHLAALAARRFEPFDPFWFEEPVSSDDRAALAEIRSRTTMRVVSGERHAGKHAFRDLLACRAADVLNPDICGCGGILELLEIAAMAEPYSATVSPHNYNSTTIGMAAMLHVSALMPNFLIAELYPHYLATGERIASVDFEVANGSATVPQAPGLGVSVDEAALTKLAERTTAASSRR